MDAFSASKASNRAALEMRGFSGAGAGAVLAGVVVVFAGLVEPVEPVEPLSLVALVLSELLVDVVELDGGGVDVSDVVFEPLEVDGAGSEVVVVVPDEEPPFVPVDVVPDDELLGEGE